VALCYGWIDGLRRAHDDVPFLQRYSRRRPGSSWSKANVAKAEALMAAGRMRPAGLAEVAAAKADGALAGGVRVAADHGDPARSRGRAGQRRPRERRLRAARQVRPVRRDPAAAQGPHPADARENPGPGNRAAGGSELAHITGGLRSVNQERPGPATPIPDHALRVDGEFVAAGRRGTGGSGASPTLVFSCTGRIACGAPADSQIRAFGRAPRQRTDQIRRSAGDCGRSPCSATERHGPHAKMTLSLAVSCRWRQSQRGGRGSKARSASQLGRGEPGPAVADLSGQPDSAHGGQRGQPRQASPLC
jgi:hypothetical protein